MLKSLALASLAFIGLVSSSSSSSHHTHVHHESVEESPLVELCAYPLPKFPYECELKGRVYNWDFINHTAYGLPDLEIKRYSASLNKKYA